MAITRVKMPDTFSGRRVPDKFTTDRCQHLHPSPRHAAACLRRQREKEQGVTPRSDKRDKLGNRI